jgi:thiol-disulfide isomerase/thioredoxin
MSKKDILRLAGIIITVLVLTTSAVVWAFNASPSNHHMSMSYEQAMQDKKPFVVMFYMEQCGYCIRFMPIYKKLAKEYKGQYNFVTVDGEDVKNRNLDIQYRIGGFPSLYIVDPVIDNRIFINATYYGDIDILKGEFDRYLRIRAMIPVK